MDLLKLSTLRKFQDCSRNVNSKLGISLESLVLVVRKISEKLHIKIIITMRCYSSYIKEGEKRREKDDGRDNVICFIKKKTQHVHVHS